MLIVVPARAGSQGVKRKNLAMVDGKPLFLRSCLAAGSLGTVVVSTDDVEVASIARLWGFETVDRPLHLADGEATVLDVTRDVVASLGWSGPTMCVQPTVQPITTELLKMMISDRPAVGAVRDRHLMWQDGPLFSDRVNRQQLDGILREVGLYYWPDVIRDPETTVELPHLEDVDTLGDLTDVRPGKSILIDVLHGARHGTGHLSRQLTLAPLLQHHELVFRTDLDLPYLADPTADERLFDLHVTDRLDSPVPSQAKRWVTFEDLSPASEKADLRVNALYEHGHRWAVLRPEFQCVPPFEVRDGRRVLVMFGGSDPARLHDRFTGALSAKFEVDAIRPGDDRSVAEAMWNADVLVTSAGRTVFEAAAVGVPAVVVAQNARELTHTHLGPQHGNLFCGWGPAVSAESLVGTVDAMLADRWMREDLSAKRIDPRGVYRVAHAIEGLLI